MSTKSNTRTFNDLLDNAITDEEVEEIERAYYETEEYEPEED